MMSRENAEFAERAELRGERQGDGTEEGMTGGVRRAASAALKSPYPCDLTLE